MSKKPNNFPDASQAAKAMPTDHRRHHWQDPGGTLNGDALGLVGLCLSQNSGSIALSESNPSQSAAHLCSVQRPSPASFQIQPSPPCAGICPAYRSPSAAPSSPSQASPAASRSFYRSSVYRAPHSCNSAGYDVPLGARGFALHSSLAPIKLAFAARPGHGPELSRILLLRTRRHP